jgi:hypothetical protein
MSLVTGESSQDKRIYSPSRDKFASRKPALASSAGNSSAKIGKSIMVQKIFKNVNIIGPLYLVILNNP